MTFHFKPPTTCQPTASPEQALAEEKRKLPFLDMLNRDLKREASPLFPFVSLCFPLFSFVFPFVSPIPDCPYSPRSTTF
jgi:hypothetical protein